MEKTILVIVLIVAIVGVVGLFSSYNFGSGSDALGSTGGITGNVILAQQGDCSTCAGYAPVCARINQKYYTFKNACEAICNGATVAAKMSCEQIPRG